MSLWNKYLKINNKRSNLNIYFSNKKYIKSIDQNEQLKKKTFMKPFYILELKDKLILNIYHFCCTT